MLRKLSWLMLLLLPGLRVSATGEPSTYFQIFVPPNNDAVRRDAALILTAIYDSTYFEIVDDGADGDTDDSKTGWLMAGQSYILYIRDNGINDDARYASGGVLKWDGDYFIVRSNNLVYASQSTNSDWQHDWVPSTDKKSIGRKFILFSPPFTSSRRDINVFAYEPNTTVQFQKISTKPKTNTGFTDVNTENPVTLFTKTLQPGEDLIYANTQGRDAMEAGETYLVVSDKPVTLQYGALFGNERDGGGYVPSSNGSSAGELLYFGVPFQTGTSGEQEIRIVSWDDANSVTLERFSNGSWLPVKSFSLNKMKAGDWVGRTHGNLNYASVFRVTCTPGKRVSVFEGNWFETGSPGTSDMATMVSAENGTSSGTRFLTYMAPPGNEQNVVNPFTGAVFGQAITHLYIFAKEGAQVTVKDAYTNGSKLNRTYTIGAERYIDCALTLTDWRNIYNGTGTTAAGPERPYLLVESDRPVSVMNTNFNDNWMCFSGSSLEQSFTQQGVISQSSAIPADTVTVTSIITTGSTVTQPRIEVTVQDGLRVVESHLNAPAAPPVPGDVVITPTRTTVVFDSLASLQPQTSYTVETQVVAQVGNNNGTLLLNNQNATVETVVTGTVGNQLQQSSSTQVVRINTSNTSQLLFSVFSDNLVTRDSTDSWNASWVDVNKDGYDDLFVTDRRNNRPNLLYLNNTQGGFTRGQNLAADSAISMTTAWADVDNDGDADGLVLNNTRRASVYYRNDNGVLVRDNSPAFVQSISYYHGGAWADYDNDGRLDLFMCNYFPTKYNELYRQGATGGFVKEQANAIPAEANQSVGPTWADYDGDGFMDLFVPNGNGFKNSLFRNQGNGSFQRASNLVSSEGGQSVGSCWGDIDNDGDLDLFVTNSNATGNFLYKNNGNGEFTRITSGAPVTDRANSHGCSFADVDNDGDLDLYVSNDRNFKLLYLNNGDGSFTKKEDEVICFNYGNAFGHAWSDFDHDGDLDLFAATHSNQPNGLFINNGTGLHWLQLTLTGTQSNKSAIGARIQVLAGGSWQLREVNSQSGFGGQSSLTQHFGLGSNTLADSVIIRWPSGVRQILTQVTADQFMQLTEPQSVRLAGGVFVDANQNGQRDEGEVLAGRAVIQTGPARGRLYTDDEGYFRCWLLPGTYTFRLLGENGLLPVSNTPAERILQNGQTSLDSLWIPAAVSCTETDLQLLMGGTAIRKGYTNNQFTLIATNQGRQPIGSYTLRWKAPASLIPSPADVPWQEILNEIENGINWKTYRWNLASLAPFGSQVIRFQHANDASVSIGDTLRLTGWVEHPGSDCNPANNQLSQTYRVVGAIDPNDLQVSPAGAGPEGFIHASQRLTYTIRFQNMGNHPATDVTLTDELPAGLDLNSLELAGQSHPGMQMRLEGRTLVFHFEQIMLPDSATDAAASQGYVIFSLKPLAGIPAGTELVNRALIQFDQYEPLPTNTVRNTIQSARQEQSWVMARVWPNPAADVVYLSLQHRLGQPVRTYIRHAVLTDMAGRVLLQRNFSEKDEGRLDLPAWLNGFYFVTLTDNESRRFTEKIWVRKQR